MFVEYYEARSSTVLDTYSGHVLKRIWKAVRFSWWMTSLLHVFPENGDFGRRIQRAEFDYLAASVAAQSSLAENYTGLLD
jgi:p-hydroxybenzoate 3-monooxygenase